MWREQVVDRMMGVIPASKKASTLDETVVTDFNDDFDLDSETSDSVPDDDSDLDSVSSQQSLVKIKGEAKSQETNIYYSIEM